MGTELGHLVLYVRDLSKMVEFYRDIVGLSVVGTIFEGRAAALTGGRTHHELLLIEVGDAPGPLVGIALDYTTQDGISVMTMNSCEKRNRSA